MLTDQARKIIRQLCRDVIAARGAKSSAVLEAEALLAAAVEPTAPPPAPARGAQGF